MNHGADIFVFNQRVRRPRFDYALPLVAFSVLGIVALTEVLKHPVGWVIVAGLGLICGAVIRACGAAQKAAALPIVSTADEARIPQQKEGSAC